MNNKDDISRRIAKLRELLGITQTELAHKIGITPQAVQKWESGGAPKGSRLLAVAKELKTSVEYLLTGYGESTNAEHKIIPVDMVENCADLSAYTEIELFDVKLSAGNGIVTWESRQEEPLVFRKAWMKRKNLACDTVKAMYVRGDSMEPFLENWDTILIDTSDTELVSGEIFAVSFKNKLFIKEISVLPDHIELISKNKKYLPIIIAEDEADYFQVLGRMVWRGG